MPDVIKPGPPNNGGGADGGGEDEQENGAVTMDLMGSGRDFPLQVRELESLLGVPAICWCSIFLVLLILRLLGV